MHQLRTIEISAAYLQPNKNNFGEFEGKKSFKAETQKAGFIEKEDIYNKVSPPDPSLYS